jgi:hypothetical protein
VTAEHADQAENIPTGQPVTVDELFRDIPVQSARDLVCDGIFDTDEELDEFLAFTYAQRRTNLA